MARYILVRTTGTLTHWRSTIAVCVLILGSGFWAQCVARCVASPPSPIVSFPTSPRSLLPDDFCSDAFLTLVAYRLASLVNSSTYSNACSNPRSSRSRYIKDYEYVLSSTVRYIIIICFRNTRLKV